MKNYPAKVNLFIEYLQLAMEDLPAEIIVIKHSVVKTMFGDMKRNHAKRELTNLDLQSRLNLKIKLRIK